MSFFNERYHGALNSIPRPGTGCHTSLLTVANYGILASVQPPEILHNIRTHIPQGTRRISDKEILDAINKALADHNRGTFIPKTRSAPIVNNGQAALRGIISQGKYSDDADLWESSPVRLMDDPQQDLALLLENLYKPEDLVWIGDRHEAGILGETIRTASEWITQFRSGDATSPHIIINPLSGLSVTKKSGDGETLRGDGNVRSYRYCMGEFDNLSRVDQIRFWSTVKLPIVALIDSGGKSIHAWLEVQKLTVVKTSGQWVSEIKNHLYDRILKPLGVDPACSNPARLSRLPGHFREEKGTYQKLLWLSPTGRCVL